MTAISGVTTCPSVASSEDAGSHAMGTPALMRSSSLTDPSQDHLDRVIPRVMHGAVVSGLIGCLFSTVGPIGGALYGAVSSLSCITVEWICDKAGCLRDDTIGKTLRVVIPLIASIAAGCLALAATGFVWAPGAILAIEVGSRGLAMLAMSIVVLPLAYFFIRMDAVENPRSRRG